MGLFGDILSTVGKVAVDAVKSGKAEEIIKSTLLPGDSIVIDANENKEIKFTISKGTESLSLQEMVNDAMTEKID